MKRLLNFSIRDILWLTLVAALIVGWVVHLNTVNRHMSNSINHLIVQQDEKLQAKQIEVNDAVRTSVIKELESSARVRSLENNLAAQTQYIQLVSKPLEKQLRKEIADLKEQLADK